MGNSVFENSLGSANDAIFSYLGALLLFKARGSWLFGLAGLFFTLAMYSYAPARIQILLLVPYIVFLRKNYFTRRSYFVFLVALMGTSIPLVYNSLYGDLMVRAVNEGTSFSTWYLSKYGDPSLYLAVVVFVKNFISHFTPNFLFLHGDSNLRHSTQGVGQLSFLDTLNALAFFCLFGLV